MSKLPEFKLETHFSKWEFKAKYHLTASDAQSISMKTLLAMASPEDRQAFEELWLGYTETFGAPDLLEAIANTYEQQNAADILCFCGASEGIFAANSVILDKDSHAIVITPNYQSHESLPVALCDATAVPLNANDNWSLDIDQIANAIKPNTKPRPLVGENSKGTSSALNSSISNAEVLPAPSTSMTPKPILYVPGAKSLSKE